MKYLDMYAELLDSKSPIGRAQFLKNIGWIFLFHILFSIPLIVFSAMINKHLISHQIADVYLLPYFLATLFAAWLGVTNVLKRLRDLRGVNMNGLLWVFASMLPVSSLIIFTYCVFFPGKKV